MLSSHAFVYDLGRSYGVHRLENPVIEKMREVLAQRPHADDFANAIQTVWGPDVGVPAGGDIRVKTALAPYAAKRIDHLLSSEATVRLMKNTDLGFYVARALANLRGNGERSFLTCHCGPSAMCQKFSGNGGFRVSGNYCYFERSRETNQ